MYRGISERIEKLKFYDIPEGYKKEKNKIIPENWNVKSLVEVVEFLDNQRRPIKESERENGPYPYYGASGIIDYVNDYIFDGDYILLGEDGANILTRSTALAYKASGKIWVNNHAHILSCKMPSDIDFIMYALESINYEKYNASTAQPKITQEVCKKLLILYPHSTKERKKIGNILSTWDKAIELKEELIEEKKKQKSGLMQKLLTGKVRLPEFDGEWKNIRLGDYLIKHTEKTIVNNQYPVLTSSRNGIFFQKDYFDGNDVASKDNTGYNVVPRNYFTYRHMSDDLIFKFNINTIVDKGIVSTLYPVFTTKSDLNSNYLRLALNEGEKFKQYALSQKQGGSRTYMYYSKLEELEFRIPLIDEQIAISNLEELTQREINLHEKELEALKLQKKGLMQLLLTGIVRVNTQEN